MVTAALEQLPNSVRLLTERGWVYFDQQQHDKSIASFDQALSVEPANELALRSKSRSFRRQRKFAEAEKVVTAALEQSPKSVHLLIESAWIDFECDKFDEAERRFIAAGELEPDNLEPIIGRVETLNRLYRRNEANELLVKLSAARPNNIKVRIHLAWSHLGLNNVSDAKRELGYVLGRDQSDMHAVNLMGVVHFNEGLYEEAKERFRAALENDPNEPAYHANLAWTLVREAGEMPLSRASKAARPKWYRFLRHDGGQQPNSQYLLEAEERCRTALKIAPAYSPAYGCLGVIAFRKGRFLEAEELLQTSIRVNPREGRYVELGSLYVQMGRYDTAKQHLERALQIDKNDASALVELGNLYFQLNEIKEAAQLFRQAMHADTENEEPSRALAIALMRAGEYGEAGRALRRSIRRLDERKRWRLHLTLSQVMTEMGEKNDDPELYEEALREIKEAISLKPEHPDPYFHAGVVRFKLEDYRGALKDFRCCLEKDADHLDAERNARLVKSFVREERRRTRGSLAAGITMGVLCILLLLGIWILYFKSTKVTPTMVLTFSPILLGLSLVAFLLPWLIRLKLPGVEAELSQPKEKISKGPDGSIGFGSTAISSGPH